MYAVGKVYRCRAEGQRLNISRRGEAVYIVIKQIEVGLNHIEEVLGIACIILKLKYLTQPAHLVVIAAVCLDIGATCLLIFPVRRNTVFRNTVHLIGSYLYLKGYAVLAYKSRMKRLIHIRLRHGNIVLETTRYRLIHLMYNTECRIAVLNRIHHNAYGKQIIDLVYGLVLVNHFLINTEEMLNSAVH